VGPSYQNSSFWTFSCTSRELGAFVARLDCGTGKVKRCIHSFIGYGEIIVVCVCIYIYIYMYARIEICVVIRGLLKNTMNGRAKRNLLH
jgi:hypothetical protein